MRRRELIRELSRSIGPLQRIGMSLMALFSPGALIVSVFIGFIEAVGEMDDEQIEALLGDD
tara:strand:+ start:3140 stop:3322 length:183 start_codon:yes stop_codon:yes gene_type:complete